MTESAALTTPEITNPGGGELRRLNAAAHIYTRTAVERTPYLAPIVKQALTDEWQTAREVHARGIYGSLSTVRTILKMLQFEGFAEASTRFVTLGGETRLYRRAAKAENQ